MAVGKRLGADKPLTEHDVAERLDHAMLRVARILADVTSDPALHQAVRSSRYVTAGLTEALQDALTAWSRGKHTWCAACRDGAFIDDGHNQVDP